MSGFNEIFKQRFTNSKQAVQACQNLAHLQGFSVRIRTSKADTIYFVCSCEGKPDLKSSKKRHRLSERCGCPWKVVLRKDPFLLTDNSWRFQPGRKIEHNHTINSSKSTSSPILTPTFDSRFNNEISNLFSNDVLSSPTSESHSYSILNDGSSHELSHFLSKPSYIPVSIYGFPMHPSIMAFEERQRRNAFNNLLN